MRPLAFILMPSLILACSQPSPAQNEGSSRRVIIEFSQARQLADARMLEPLGRACDTRLDFITTISARSAAYRLWCSALDPQCMAAQSCLSRQAGVVHAELDQKVAPPSVPREKLP